MKGNKYITILVFLFSLTCFAQQSTIALIDLIKATETKFDVKFSYANQDVEGVLITTPKTSLDLNQTIDYLNSNTSLEFKSLDNRYVTVSTSIKKETICGYIFNAKDKQPLFGVTISVVGKNTGVISDENGYFILDNINKDNSVNISYLGFKTETLKAFSLLKPQGCNSIYLDESAETLNQIIITKFLTNGLKKLKDGSLILSTTNFGVLPGLTEPDVLQSIQVLPGIESSNESIANINVRGGTNDQNLMLWDGIKMYHSGHFFGLISAYNPNLTNQVIVTKNGTSSQYSDGVSSTINMLTKDELSGQFSGNVGANLISADAFFNIPITKKLELLISGRRAYTDAFKTPTYTNYFNRSFQDSDINTNQNIENSSTSSEFFFYDYSAKLLFDLNRNHKFRANVIGIKNNLDYAETITDNNNQSNQKSSVLSQDNLGFGANWDANWSSKFNTKLSAFYSQYNVNASDLRESTNQLLQQANEVLETGIKLTSNYKLSNHLNLLNGYEFNEIGILNQTLVNAPAYERTKKDVLLKHAAFTEAEFNKNNTYFRLGVRANYFQKFDKLLIEPRLNIRQQLSSKFALKLEGEFKNQSATQIVDFQDDFLGVENRRWILANNSTIPISTSKQAAFGINYKQNNFYVDVTGFYKHVNGITASNQGFYNNFQYLNAKGEYTSNGIEFLINKTAKQYSSWISYTYSTNNYDFESFNPSTFPNNVDIRHSVSVAGNYSVLDNLELSVGANWHSGLPYTKPIEDNPTVQTGNDFFVNYDAPNAQQLPSFFRLDASLNYQPNWFNAVKTSIRIGVRNVTNQKNIINRYYKVNPDDSTAVIEINNTSLPITPNASLRISF